VTDARPILKWAGGKSSLLDLILPLLPAKINTYYEPFVGGAAVFFKLASEKRFERAVLSDRNPELINVYQAVQEDVGNLIDKLAYHEDCHDEEYYYEVRKDDPSLPVERAARFIYLNKTCFNGLHRVNRTGKFNVPFGHRKNPTICDHENLIAASLALQGVKLEVGDFESLCREAEPGDSVYLDPPYIPLTATSNFTAYCQHPFTMKDQERLASVFASLAACGVCAVLSNSSAEEARKLYAAFRVQTVPVRRSINSKAKARGPVYEILVSS